MFHFQLKEDFRSALFNVALMLVNDLKRPLDAVPYLQQLLKVAFSDFSWSSFRRSISCHRKDLKTKCLVFSVSSWSHKRSYFDGRHQHQSFERRGSCWEGELLFLMHFWKSVSEQMVSQLFFCPSVGVRKYGYICLCEYGTFCCVICIFSICHRISWGYWRRSQTMFKRDITCVSRTWNKVFFWKLRSV